jgi:hypothetical protein
MKTRSILAAVILAVSAVATGAVAASYARDTFIKEQDQDGDGSVSKDEFAATRQIQFARTDTDKNGTLSHDEYVGDYKSRLEKSLSTSTLTPEKKDEEHMRQMRQAEVRFGVLDSDKSGAITAAEFAYSGWRMFTTHDSNNDGVVSAADPVKEETN